VKIFIHYDDDDDDDDDDNLLDYGSRLQAELVQHRHTYSKI